MTAAAERPERVLMRKLAVLRKGRGLTQRRVAELSGIDRGYIGRLEAGQLDARLSTVLRYARAIGVRITGVPVDLEAEGGDPR